VEVDELVALTPAAEAALWRFVCGIDLMGRVVAPLRPPDDALGHLLADPRRLEARAAEGLWVSVLDASAALEARRYGREDRLVLEVGGHGRLALEGGPDGAQARRTAVRADVAMPADVLGALLLGGVGPAALAAAGRLEERTPGALARLHAMLAAPRAPWCPFVF
jgi:predicted acetyltransferase